METLIDYLQMWETQRPDQTLYRFVDVEGRELEHYTYRASPSGRVSWPPTCLQRPGSGGEIGRC